ncbi:MAG: glycosyltransferase [Planctomycetes bacterium]|nr:glycosyltransferase [Planctomycetota bacterium]
MSTILVICPYVPHPATHGGSIRSRVLLQAIAQDHALHVAAAVANDDDRGNGATLARELGLTLHELPARANPTPRRAGKLGAWLRLRSELLARRWRPDAPRLLARLLAARRFDLAVLDSSFVLPVWRGGVPTLLYLHNLEHAVFARADRIARGPAERCTRRIETARIRAAERRALLGARLTVTVSGEDRALALALAPAARVETVPNTVDLALLPLLPPGPPGPPAPPGPVRLLFVGGLDYPPNLEAVTELVEHHLPVLRAAFPDLTVRLVGRDPAGAGARLRDRPGVEPIGPAGDLLPHYRASHAAYLPIRSGGGTRIKILEAWALGLPVLSTAVGCEGLPAVDGRHLRRFETPEQGLAALREVLAGQAAALRAAGRALVEQQFSHRAAIARLRELVADTLAGR